MMLIMKKGEIVIKKVLEETLRKILLGRRYIHLFYISRTISLSRSRSFLTDATLKARFRRMEPMAVHRRGWVEVNREPLA